MGGTYGGSISATVLNIPGTPASAPTAIEGYALTKKGEAEVALGINVFTSFMGNNLGLIMLLLTMPLFVKLSMMFGPWEMFWFGIFGVFIAANLSEGDTLMGMISATAGLIISCIGMDPIDGSPRFSFDSTYLTAGIPLIPAMIGLFGFTEVFEGLTDMKVKSFPLRKTSLVGAARMWWKYRWLSVRTSVLGYIIGVAPGIGANVSCWVGYDHARTMSKEPELFGHGSIEGLIGSETCNMANVPGAYAPVLSLGVPGDAPTAIMLGILMLHGIRPGPTFMITNPEWLYQIVVALFISGILFVIIGTYAGKALVRLFVSTPRTAMSAIVAVLCAMGAYAANINLLDIYTAFFFGVLGIIMKGLGIPVSPLVLGLILGADLLDVEFRRALLAGKGPSPPSSPGPSAWFCLPSLPSLCSSNMAIRSSKERRGKRIGRSFCSKLENSMGKENVMNRATRGKILACFIVLTLSLVGYPAVQAQDYPTKPITLINPMGAGGVP